jgi:hypothetical protein
MTGDFEKAFDDFMECREYDQAENALFSAARSAFRAGWMAAGGKVLQMLKTVRIVHREPT